MKIVGLLTVATLSLTLLGGPVAASPVGPGSRVEVTQPVASERRGAISIRDGRDNDGFDIARVRAGRDASRRHVKVRVKFRRQYEHDVITVWNVYVNTDRDRRPEFVVISYPDSGDGQVFRSRGWRGLATGRPLTRCGGAQRDGLVLAVRVDVRCLGLARSTKVAIVAQETYSVDGYDGSADDWAPGKRTWSARF